MGSGLGSHPHHPSGRRSQPESLSISKCPVQGSLGVLDVKRRGEARQKETCVEPGAGAGAGAAQRPHLALSRPAAEAVAQDHAFLQDHGSFADCPWDYITENAGGTHASMHRADRREQHRLQGDIVGAQGVMLYTGKPRGLLDG